MDKIERKRMKAPEIFGIMGLLIMLYGCQITSTVPLQKEELTTIVYPPKASFQEIMAAKEIRRYIYLRTGKLLPMVQNDTVPVSQSNMIVVGQKNTNLIDSLTSTYPDLRTDISSLKAQQYRLKDLMHNQQKIVLIAGADAVGTLYGAYRFVELFGVSFFLHGDVVPDKQIALVLPDIDETGKPLFNLRGLNPWGTHPFGFDLWNTNDYKAVFTQLSKMRMNFLGIHCYPEGIPYAEPTVWIGLQDDFDKKGKVKFSYPSVYYNTAWKANWGPILPKKTGEYSFGASILFESDDWGPDVMKGFTPRPDTQKGYNEVFNRTGEMFGDAFSFARLVGVKTCIGTEAPLTIPKLVQERLKQQDKDPSSKEIMLEVYESMFRRIMNTHPLDYYWIWTSEDWIWGGNTNEQSSNVNNDMELAYQAMNNVNAPFGLVTAGWVLGPAEDRAGFDKVLPKNIAMSAISRRLGHEPVDAAFGDIKGRDTWAIPWMEGDLTLQNPQLWVGRTRKDAADALAYGCSGLMGLHWRTRIVGPNVSALANAGWDQSPWNPEPGKLPEESSLITPQGLVPDTSTMEGAIHGFTANYAKQQIEGTEDDELYQTCRYGMTGYNLIVPDGSYKVTLKFCEPHFEAAGKRVFDVLLQSKTVAESIDIFKEVGKFKALDYTFEHIEINDGWLKIRFEDRMPTVSLSGIVVENNNFVRKINCGGRKYKDFVADYSSATPFAWGEPREGLAVKDFYSNWALAMFGPEVAKEAADFFSKVDGNLPRPASNGCPCGIYPDIRSWQTVALEYEFIDEFEKLKHRVKGGGNLERFNYWLNTFKHLKALARVQCELGLLIDEIEKVKKIQDARSRKVMAMRKAVPAFKNVIDSYRDAYLTLLATVSTNGGLANVINLEQGTNFWHRVIEKPRKELKEILGGNIPDEIQLEKEYNGPARIIVPTVRTSLLKGEALDLKVIVLDNERPKQARFYFKELGSNDDYKAQDLIHIARGVYKATLNKCNEDIEYYIKVVTSKRQELYFPADAPLLPQTVVVINQPDEKILVNN